MSFTCTPLVPICFDFAAVSPPMSDCAVRFIDMWGIDATVMSPAATFNEKNLKASSLVVNH